MYRSRRQTKIERERARISRLERGYPDHQPPHPIQNNTRYLITAACFEHQHYLRNPSRRERLRSELVQECSNCEISLLAWCVLTNHYHLLVSTHELKHVGQALGKAHGRTAHAWNTEDSSQGRKIWYRYADRAIRSDRHFWTCVNYVHFNPVKHGYVKRALDWPHSSIHRYIKAGLVDQDWDMREGVDATIEYGEA